MIPNDNASSITINRTRKIRDKKGVDINEVLVIKQYYPSNKSSDGIQIVTDWETYLNNKFGTSRPMGETNEPSGFDKSDAITSYYEE